MDRLRCADFESASATGSLKSEQSSASTLHAHARHLQVLADPQNAASLLRTPSRRRCLQVLALAGLLLAAPTRSQSADPAAPIAVPIAVPTEPPLVQWPQEARVSLELKRAPLSTLLAMLSAQSGVRFRLAAIPDVEVSVSLQNAPLRQAVRDLLALHGFDLRPGPDAFWLVPAARSASKSIKAQDADARTDARTEGWRWWTGTAPPPPRWMAPGEDEIAYDGPLTASGVPGLAPFGVQVRMQPVPPSLLRWKGGAQKFQAASPGVLPSPSSPVVTPGASGPAPRWCARWPVFLRLVPARCLLVIESERPANFYVNGARLLSDWHGRRTLDVSGALQAGSNLLALEWPPLSPASIVAPSRAAAVFEPAPTVRYEWLVAQ